MIIVRRWPALIVATVMTAATLVFAPAALAAACAPTSAIDGTATVLTFTNSVSCTWSVPAGVTSANVLVVAGGGGGVAGAVTGAAGGGAGGLLYSTGVTLTPGGTQNVVVGAGGQANNATSSADGGSSSFGSITTTGGGGAGQSAAVLFGAGGPGRAGGSGGGGGYGSNGVNLGGTGVAGQGYAGGNSTSGGGGGGGGGAGGAGTAGTGVNGPGLSNSITGTAVTYAIGGSGATLSPYAGGGSNPSIGGGGRAVILGIADAGNPGVVVVRFTTPPTTPVFTASSAPSAGVVGTAYAGYTYAASGPPAPTFAVASGSLPSGLSLSSAGVLSGTPTAAGTFTFTVSATNSAGSVTSGTQTITVTSVPSFTAASPPLTATAGSAYAGYTFTASGSPAPTFTVSSGLLPLGLSLSTAGVLSGTPTLAGSSTFKVTATNSAGTATTSNITITVAAAPIAPVFVLATPTSPATVGTAYSYTYTALGSPAPTFSVVSGSLPAGLSLSSAGVLSGTPTTAGSSTFTVQATNAGGTVSAAASTVVVQPAAAGPAFVNQTPPATATVGTPYAGYTYTTTGYPAPTYGTTIGGGPPLGMSIDPVTGVLSGTPLLSGSYPITVVATNATGSVNSTTTTLVVAPTPVAPVLVLSSPPTTGTAGTAYAGYTFTATGVPAPTFSLASGTLPAGLTLDSSGVLSGTPTTAGAYSFAVLAGNSAGTVTSPTRTITIAPTPVAPVLTAASPPGGAATAPYGTYNFTATGVPAPTFSVTTGSLPLGLSLSSAGALTGTPLVAGTYPFTVTATNSAGTANAAVSITIAAAPSGPVFLAASPPATGTVGTAYSTYQFSALAVPAATFAVTSGSLPPGLSLTSAGVLSGFPTTAGAYAFAVTATNSSGAVSTGSLPITIAPAPVAPTFTASGPLPNGTAGVAYGGYTFTAGGTPAPTFSVTSGLLPLGLSLSSSGVLSGTPLLTGTSTFTVTATNSAGVANAPLTLTVDAAPVAPVFTASTPPTTGTVGTAYPSYTFTAFGVPNPTFSLTSGTLPAGLTLDSAGVLSGTPTAAGVSTFRVTAGNSAGTTSTGTLTITVAPQPVAPVFVQATPPTTGTAGTVYPSYTFTASGVPDPTFAVASGFLPLGLSLSSAGVLSGTPLASGASNFTVSATNSAGTVNTGQITITIAPTPVAPVFVLSSPPGGGTVGTAYAGFTYTALGVPAPTFSVASGSLPPGLALSSAGVLSGTPTTAGTYNFAVLASNSAGTTTTSTTSIAVDPAPVAPVFTASTPPATATFGVAYPGYTFTASGSPAPTFAVAGGSLPLGLTLSSAGVLSGTPLATGTSTFTVSATNSSGTAISPSRSIVVNPAPSAPLFIAQLAPNTGTVGTAYAPYTYTATGFPAPTFAVASGLLPDGLTLNSTTGVLSGTPTTPGTSVFTVSATNASGTVTSLSNTIAVSPTPAAPAFVDQSPPGTAVAGTPYSYAFTASGYPSPTFAVASGLLPLGLTLSSSGLLSGTPLLSGTSTFTVSATNASGAVSTGSKTILVNPAAVAPTFPLITPIPPPATVGMAYTYTVTASGYPAPTFSTTSPLPAGLTLTSDGVLSGTPTSNSGSPYPITVTATNGVNPDATETLSLIVAPQPTVSVAPLFISLTPGDATQGSAYSFQFTAAGFPTPTFSTTGPLPAGLTLSSAGLLSGTPTAAGDYPFTVTATNGTAPDATQNVTLHVAPAPAAPTFTSSTPPDATVLSLYTMNFTAGGTPSTMTFTTSDPLPLGLVLLPTGTLSGIPLPGTQGDYPVTVTASNGTAPDATYAFTLHVNRAPTAPLFTSTTPPNGTVGTPYSYSYVATGYPTAMTYTTSSSLPAGLSLSSAGVLSGTPTASGTFTITVTASNGVAPDAPAISVFTIAPASVAPSITSSAPPSGGVGQPYTFSFTASGYPAPTFATSDALPLGLTLGSNGQLSGVPLPGTAGDHTITVTASNGVSPSDSTTVTLHIDPALTAPAFTASTPPDGVVGTAYPGYTFQASGNPSPLFTSTSLPAGMSLSLGGVLSGTPTAAGDQAFTVTATNGVSPAATATVHLFVGTVPVFTASSPPSSATAGSAYSYTFAASGNPAPAYGTVAQLPAGWNLDANTGALTASSPVPGTFSFSVTATNSAGSATAGPFTITVAPAPAAPVFTASTPPATVTAGTAITNYRFTASGNPAPTFSTTGSVPPGLTLSSAGVLSGTPTTAGTYVFTVTAANGVAPDASTQVTMDVDAAPVFTASSPPLSGTAGTTYSYTFQASGNPAPTYSTLSPLPAGWTLDSASGWLTNSSPAAGSFDVSVKATNSAGAAVAGPFTITTGSAAAAPSVGAASPPATAAVGSAYGPYTFTASGYPAPTWSVVNGTLPPGLTLDPSTGELSGSPTTPGTYTFQVRAHNASGDDTSSPITITVAAVATAPTLTATTPPLSGRVGAIYGGYTFTASGSPAPTFGVVNGSLPAGLALSSAGVLSGAPTTAGTFTFSVRATNSAGADTSTPITVRIEAAAPATTPLDAPTGVTLTAGRSSLRATWAAVTGATSYTVTASPGTATCTTTGTSCVLGGRRGTSYTVTVVAHSDTGVSPASAPSNAATPTAPSVPATAPTSAPTTLTTDKGQVGILVVGEPVTAIGTGFAPFSTATVVIYSSPMQLAEVTTDGNGDFSAPVTVPKLEPGAHNLVASGTAPDGTTRMIRLPVTVNEAKATDVGGVARLTVPSGGSITLLDSTGAAATKVTVPQGVYTLNPKTGLITFTENKGFVGTADPVSYRVIDQVGTEVTGTYAGIVRSLTGRAALGLPARLVGATGPKIPCRITTGTMTRCVVTARIGSTVVGKGTATAAAAAKARGLDVAVPLTSKARKLAAKPGGARITYTVVVTQTGHAVTTTTHDTATVLAKQITLPGLQFSKLSAKVSSSHRAYLTAVRAKLGGARAVTCTGNAQTKGGDTFTRKLALKRAKKVCKILTAGLPVKSTTRAKIHQPPKHNTPETRARNRRVVVVITN